MGNFFNCAATYNVVVFGGDGSGKTTLVNRLVDYSQGCKFDKINTLVSTPSKRVRRSSLRYQNSTLIFREVPKCKQAAFSSETEAIIYVLDSTLPDEILKTEIGEAASLSYHSNGKPISLPTIIVLSKCDLWMKKPENKSSTAFLQNVMNLYKAKIPNEDLTHIPLHIIWTDYEGGGCQSVLDTLIKDLKSNTMGGGIFFSEPIIPSNA